MQEDLFTMEQFLKVLQGVHDKQTADAAALGMGFLTVAETLRKQKNHYGSTALENTRIGSVIGEVTDTLDKDLWNDTPQVTPLPAGGEAGE